MRYTVGFLFDENQDHVALIHKEHPDWQKGLLNGIGGKLTPGESPADAHEREFTEETGVSGIDWEQYARLSFGNQLFYFRAFDNSALARVKTVTDEIIEVVKIRDLLTRATVSNTVWMALAALDTNRRGELNTFYIRQHSK